MNWQYIATFIERVGEFVRFDTAAFPDAVSYNSTSVQERYIISWKDGCGRTAFGAGQLETGLIVSTFRELPNRGNDRLRAEKNKELQKAAARPR